MCLPVCECVCVCMHTLWLDCQLRLAWHWVATPQGRAGLRGGLFLISSIRLPCVMAADPLASGQVLAMTVPIGRCRAPVTAGYGLTSWPGAALTLLLSNSQRRWQRWHFGWFALGLIKDTLLNHRVSVSQATEERDEWRGQESCWSKTFSTF